MQVVHPVYPFYLRKFHRNVDIRRECDLNPNRMKGATWSQKSKQVLQAIDRALGNQLCRRFPNLAQGGGFDAEAGFNADLKIKLIRKHEEECDPQDTGFRTFWNRVGKKR